MAVLVHAEPGSLEAGERPLEATGRLRNRPRKGGTTDGHAPSILAFDFPAEGGCAISAALAAMPPWSWWLVLWLPPLATLPAVAVREEEAAMSGNPGSGREASLLGVRVTRGRGQAPPLSASIRMLHILICSGSNRWARHSWPLVTSLCLKLYFIRLHKSHETQN